MKILVYTTVFPNSVQPNLGVFVRERMFNVARQCEIKVVAPVPWFPFINFIKKNYRPLVPSFELQEGIEVYHPKFFNIPKFLKFLDALLLFLSSVLTLAKIKKNFDFDVIDAHFAYPNGVAAVMLGKLFCRPVVITVRGNERLYVKESTIRPLLKWSLNSANRIFSVCNELIVLLSPFVRDISKFKVVPNGVDLVKFKSIDKLHARNILGLPHKSQIIISAGWLTEWKGFHRIIKILPQIQETIGEVHLVIVGGQPTNNGFENELKQLADSSSCKKMITFAGPRHHSEMYKWFNAADVFCLATQGEGWANVFLEAMACGLPVVTTRVGGNPEVVANEDVGILYDLEDEQGLIDALLLALRKEWGRERIVAYAQNNSWDSRVEILLKEFDEIIKV